MIIDKGNSPKELIECNEKYESDYLNYKKNHEIDKNCYAHDKVKDRLNEKYNYKCAYCDSLVGDTSYLNVEHYRPKYIYYWLAYKWDNLLLSCEICNRKKGKQFPTMNFNVIYHNGNCTIEEPLLLNPEKDDLVEFYKFNTNGKIFAKNNNKRAEKTIWICKLNRFVLRYKSRKKIIDSICRDVAIFMIKIKSNEDIKLLIREMLKARVNNREEYSLMFEVFLLNFDEIFEELYFKIKKKFL